MSARELAEEYEGDLETVFEWLIAKIRVDRDEHGRSVEQFWQLFNSGAKYGPPTSPRRVPVENIPTGELIRELQVRGVLEVRDE